MMVHGSPPSAIGRCPLELLPCPVQTAAEITREILWRVFALAFHLSRLSVIRQWVFDGLSDQVDDAELAVLEGAELTSFRLEVGLGHEVGLWIA